MSEIATCLELSISMPGFSSSFPSSGGGGGVNNTKDLDMNRIPSEEGDDSMEDEDESCPSITTNNGAAGGVPRKKLRLTKEQSRLLEESFRLNHTLNPRQKEVLAMQLKLKPRQVEVWFQNRRARSKLKQTEMECEYLKRWFGSLTEQNRRLQKELEELRAMKATAAASQNHRTNNRPSTTLTMCPRCERVTSVNIHQDNVGPTTTASSASTTISDNPTLLGKGAPLFQPGRQHPSAAC
ncbi:OLC1v1032025C1 [Oldenlandia corymbosa var. corymbosa]|uniref:OLC1v1032025C1 n=1 Tax=Oldenlandia corymbosa var. corymbosa TaxID=529605 RepID=A0AAV1CJR6_OLDCO|nr:OLC1v1032025C1 [Oldenlandia corymbosa var. corymbosa]